MTVQPLFHTVFVMCTYDTVFTILIPLMVFYNDSSDGMTEFQTSSRLVDALLTTRLSGSLCFLQRRPRWRHLDPDEKRMLPEVHQSLGCCKGRHLLDYHLRVVSDIVQTLEIYFLTEVVIYLMSCFLAQNDAY